MVLFPFPLVSNPPMLSEWKALDLWTLGFCSGRFMLCRCCCFNATQRCVFSEFCYWLLLHKMFILLQNNIKLQNKKCV